MPGVDVLMELIGQDKKVRRGTLTLYWCGVLVRRLSRTTSTLPRSGLFLTENLQMHDPERWEPDPDKIMRQKIIRMTASDWLSLVVVLFCLLISAFFAGSETALTASSRARMARLEKQGNRRAAIVNRLLAQRERLIGGLMLGNNLVNIAASALATGVLLAWFRNSRSCLRHIDHDRRGGSVLRDSPEDCCV